MKFKKIKKLQNIIKVIIFYFWKKKLKKFGNVHLSKKNASLKKIPFSRNKAWLRPTSSDASRVQEYFDNIYYSKSYLHKRILDQKPSILIDIGANIGLSTLSLIEEFKTIKKVIALEPEKNNFEILDLNFKIWSMNFKNVEFLPLNAAITSDASDIVVQDLSLYDLSKKGTVSGTFSYKPVTNQTNIEKINNNIVKNISLNDLVNDIPLDEKIIIKIDIEGGEEYLFKNNTDWLKRTLYFTCEIHDKYHPQFINSSKNMIETIAKNNFAIDTKNSSLFLYNRNN